MDPEEEAEPVLPVLELRLRPARATGEDLAEGDVGFAALVKADLFNRGRGRNTVGEGAGKDTGAP